jgi:hypothetical protein
VSSLGAEILIYHWDAEMKRQSLEGKPMKSREKEISKCNPQEESKGVFFGGGGESQGTMLEHYQERVIRVTSFGVPCDKQ